ncbi:MAG: hypothetical protein M2R46_05476 [Verrucomicrobia subdivision 3 bacterium]|nr:hypothetical protein [Limisphaerales bacterium]
MACPIPIRQWKATSRKNCTAGYSRRPGSRITGTIEWTTLLAAARRADTKALPTAINTESRRVRRSLREHLAALRYRITDAWRLKRACHQRQNPLKTP